MNKEDSIRFAGLMEDYLNIPSFVCEMIQQQLEENKYKEVVEYVIQRRNEIESKEDYISEQQAINMWIKKLKEKDKEIDRLNNKVSELENINEKIGLALNSAENKVDRLNNIINELENFAIKIYQKELDKTSDWWLQEELKTNFDDINLATNFRLEEELKENK